MMHEMQNLPGLVPHFICLIVFFSIGIHVVGTIVLFVSCTMFQVMLIMAHDHFFELQKTFK